MFWWYLSGMACTEFKSELMSLMPLKVEEPSQKFENVSNVELIPWVTDVPQVTDIQFFSNRSKLTALIFQKRWTTVLGRGWEDYFNRRVARQNRFRAGITWYRHTSRLL